MILKTEALQKIYKETHALDDVSIELKKGKIYGFIGKNGAGKTTFIRQITGLSYPTGGTIELFGETSQKGLENARKRIGVMVEHSGLYPEMNIHEILKLQMILKSIKNPKKADEVLEFVGLMGTKNKKFKDFSMGMKQRLGIACALLNNPELLILDEPINGLDPIGIIEVRKMLQKLNAENGTTILISSHILGELHKLATDYIMIDSGKIIDRCSANELEQKCQKHYILSTSNNSSAMKVLNELFRITPELNHEGKIKIFDELDAKAVGTVLLENKLAVYEFSYIEESLESYFVSSIGGTH